jgi:uncharacterized protein YndB with AHSA1/START domain
MNPNEQHGKFTSPAEVRLVRILPGPIERVWEYLTDPEKRARWFAGGPMELRVGGKVRLLFRHKDLAPNETPPKAYEQHHDPGTAMDGIVTRCEPPRVLAFTFGSEGESEATFELTPQGKNVLLVLTHRAREGDVPYMAEFGSGWHTHFAILLSVLAGTPAPAFWSLHTRLKADYEKLRLAASETRNP